MRVSEPRYHRDLRRLELARNLIELGARTRTVERWSGLSTHSIRSLYREIAAGNPSMPRCPPRGVPPGQVGFFWTSAQNKSQSTILAGFLLAFNVLPPLPSSVPPANLACPARGELLCTAYSEFRAFVPNCALTIEHGMLLLSELVRGSEISFGNCNTCQTLVLLDRLAVRPPQCGYCEHKVRAGCAYATETKAPGNIYNRAVETDAQPIGWRVGTQGNLF